MNRGSEIRLANNRRLAGIEISTSALYDGIALPDQTDL